MDNGSFINNIHSNNNKINHLVSDHQWVPQAVLNRLIGDALVSCKQKVIALSLAKRWESVQGKISAISYILYQNRLTPIAQYCNKTNHISCVRVSRWQERFLYCHYSLNNKYVYSVSTQWGLTSVCDKLSWMKLLFVQRTGLLAEVVG